MKVIHFTHNATDPLRELRTTGAHFVPLADEATPTSVACS